MTRQVDNGDTDRVDAAINRVLAAEAQAREAVEACRTRAAAILLAAEERMQRIAERADARIGLAHRIADARVERALERLLAPEQASSGASAQAEDARQLDGAIAALVDEIIGAERP